MSMFNISSGSNDVNNSSVIAGANTTPTLKKSCATTLAKVDTGLSKNGIKAWTLTFGSDETISKYFYLGARFKDKDGNPRLDAVPTHKQLNELRVWDTDVAYSSATITEIVKSKGLHHMVFNAIDNDEAVESHIIESIGLPAKFNSLEKREKFVAINEVIAAAYKDFLFRDEETRNGLRNFFKALDVAKGQTINSLTRQRVLIAYLRQVLQARDLLSTMSHSDDINIGAVLEHMFEFTQKTNNLKCFRLEDCYDRLTNALQACTGVYVYVNISKTRDGGFYVKSIDAQRNYSSTFDAVKSNINTALRGESTATVVAATTESSDDESIW